MLVTLFPFEENLKGSITEAEKVGRGNKRGRNQDRGETGARSGKGLVSKVRLTDSVLRAWEAIGEV